MSCVQSFTLLFEQKLSNKYVIYYMVGNNKHQCKVIKIEVITVMPNIIAEVL